MAFQYYKSITMAESQSGTADSTDWPLAIALDGNVQAADADLKTIANGGYVTSSSGYDIRPYADSGLTTPLTFELVYYDPVNGKLEMHVKIPTLSASTDTVIYLAFGDSGITTDGSSTGTWNSAYMAVYHLKDGTSLALTDSTSNANTLTNTNGATATTGQIDGGVGLVAASSQKLSISASLVGTALTYSGWVKATSFPQSYNAVFNSRTATAFKSQQLFVKSNGKLALYFATTGGDSIYDGSGVATLSTGTWYYLAATYDSTNGLVAYVNGVQDGTAAAAGNAITPGTLFEIGQDQESSPRYWNGVIDEVCVSNTPRSASWFLSDYNSQVAGSTFITWGAKVPVSNDPYWEFAMV